MFPFGKKTNAYPAPSEGADYRRISSDGERCGWYRILSAENIVVNVKLSKRSTIIKDYVRTEYDAQRIIDLNVDGDVAERLRQR